MIGATVSHYEILEKIGEGGMGQVYRARDTHLDRVVALKVLPAEKVADPERKLRFVREAKAASSLSHPNIVTIHDIDSSGGVDLIAMEFVAGKTLDQLIGRKGLQPGVALKYGVQTENVKAYQLCLNGFYQMNRFTPDTLMKAKGYFEQAIAEDPRYPVARYGLGLYFLHTAHFGFQRPRDALARARELSSKALEIDDGFALGYALQGMAKAMDYDWPGAEQAFRRALELDRRTIELWPGYDFQYLVSMRRLDEAVAASRRALEQDPLSPFARWRLAYRHYVRREFDLAIQYCRSSLELDPNYVAANDFLGLSLLQQGKSDEAIQALEKSVVFSRRAPFTLGALGFACAIAGQTDKARQLLAELSGFPPQVFVPPSSFGRIHLGLGELDPAFDWFEKAVDERDGIVAHVHVSPEFDRLRTHPRYGALLLRMNLPSSPIKP